MEKIYEAALDPGQWGDVLTSVAKYLGCPIVSIVPLYHPARAFFSTGMESGAQPYAEYWWEKDSITHTALRKKAQGLVCDWDLLSWERIASDPFYQEFRRSLGIGHCCAFVSEIDPGALYGMGAHFDLGHIPSDAKLEMIQLVAKHVNRAAAIQERTSTAAANAKVDRLLAVLDCAAALVDDTGRILNRNTALRVGEGDGFRIVGGRLTCSRVEDQVALDKMIGNVRAGSDHAAPAFILIARPSGRRPFLVRIMPLNEARFEIVGSAARRQSLVLIVDLESDHLKRPDAALRQLGLSPTEARVAALVGSGYAPQQAALLQGVSEETVRKQLKSVFSKLRISRQAELAVIVSKVSVLQS